MNKTRKIITTLIFLILFIILGNNKSNAGSLYLNNLDFDAKINQDGSMNVTETWDISINETNTLFKTFKTDKDKYSSITNVQVSEIIGGTEKKFTQINTLMYHVTEDCYYGLTNDDGNFEIAWGVGLDNSRATKKYKISYKVNDAIGKYQDYAELYWQFVGSDFDISCEKVTGTIILPQNASSKEDIKVWGHTEGLNGEIYATDTNKIEFEVNKFISGRYIEIRTLFPISIVPISNRTYTENRLDDVLSEEIVWANEANARRQMAAQKRKKVTIIFAVIIAAIDVIIIIQIIKMQNRLKGEEEINPSQEFKYFREIPRKNATPAQAVYLYNKILSTVSTNQMGNIFSATLLDLCLKKYIEFEEIPGDKKNIIIKILKKEENKLEDSEKIVFQYLLEVSKENSKITIKDIEKYMKQHAANLVKMKEDIEKASLREMEINNLYDKESADNKVKYNNTLTMNIVMGWIGFILLAFVSCFLNYINIKIWIIALISFIILDIVKIVLIYKYLKRINVYTQKGIDEIQMWRGLKKYMEDFSMLDKREIPEIAVWEHFLVYATAFGKADKVIEQLKAVYRELGRSYDFDDSSNSYMYFVTKNNFSSSFTNAIGSAFITAYESNYSSSYSSGLGSGGGFSGGGGGGRWSEAAVAADNDVSELTLNGRNLQKDTHNFELCV